MPRDLPVGFSTRQVCDLAGVAPSTLNGWTRGAHPLVEPSVVPAAGKRSDRYWSVRDLVIVRVIKSLRQAGCPLQQLRRAGALVAEIWDSDLAAVVLFWDGSDLIATDPWGEVQSLIRHPGQHMFLLLALPLDEWRHEAERQAREVDVEAIRERRSKRAGAARRLQDSYTLRTSAAPKESPTAPREGGVAGPQTRQESM